MSVCARACACVCARVRACVRKPLGAARPAGEGRESAAGAPAGAGGSSPLPRRRPRRATGPRQPQGLRGARPFPSGKSGVLGAAGTCVPGRPLQRHPGVRARWGPPGFRGEKEAGCAPRSSRRCVAGASAGSLRAGCPGGVCLPDSGSMNPSPLLREPVTGCKWIPSNPRGPAQARRPRRRGSGPLRSHPGCQQASQPPRGNLRRGQGWPGTWRELRGCNQRLAGAVSTCRERWPPSVTSKS